MFNVSIEIGQLKYTTYIQFKFGDNGDAVSIIGKKTKTKSKRYVTDGKYSMKS